MDARFNSDAGLNQRIYWFQLAFKFGLLISIMFLIIGIVVAPSYGRISAVAEGGVAFSCIAAVLANVLEGYAYTKFNKGLSTVQKCRGLLGNFLYVVLLLSVAAVLLIHARRDWLGIIS